MARATRFSGGLAGARAAIPGSRPFTRFPGPGMAFPLFCHPPERNVAMGLSWGRATGQHACPTEGTGFCSCWLRLFRELIRPVRRLLSGGGTHVRR